MQKKRKTEEKPIIGKMFITITVFFMTHDSVEFVICPLTHRYQHAICVSYLENHFSEQPVKIKIGKIVSVEY